jgi:hypothetical protein
MWVFDYGICPRCLKLNDGLLVVNQLSKMCKLHLCLAMHIPTSPRIRVVLDHKKHTFRSWLMLKSQPTPSNDLLRIVPALLVSD